jgi:hypothetical protein
MATRKVVSSNTNMSCLVDPRILGTLCALCSSNNQGFQAVNNGSPTLRPKQVCHTRCRLGMVTLSMCLLRKS